MVALLAEFVTFVKSLVLAFQIGYLEAELRANGVDPYSDGPIDYKG